MLVCQKDTGFHRTLYCLAVVLTNVYVSVLSVGAADTKNESVIGFNYEDIPLNMPKGLSDFSANKDIATGLVYIAGGCDSAVGNVYVDGTFQCSSLSKSLYSFDPINEEFDTSLPEMPLERYRHAAVLIDGNLWIHGGRDVNDSVVANIDVYNIEAKKWSTFVVNTTESDQYHGVSDHGAFPNHETKHAYFCGGYTSNYTTRAACFSIDTVQSLLLGTDGSGGTDATTTTATTPAVVVVPRGSLTVGRGDLAVVANSTRAIATGGFSDANNWCEPYATTEIYYFETDVWTVIDEMNIPRGDKALVELDGSIYAFGGERELPNICELVGEGNEPGPEQKRVTVNDVELYDTNTKQWVVLSDLPAYRFRFAAVSFDELEKIYAFGGQLTYNATCKCLPTTTEITVYTEKIGQLDTGKGDDDMTQMSAAANSGRVVFPHITNIGILLLVLSLCGFS